MRRNKFLVGSFLFFFILTLIFFGCNTENKNQNEIDSVNNMNQNNVGNNPDSSKPYSNTLEERIRLAGAKNVTSTQSRGYLPDAMFVNLPDIPKDFNNMRTIVHTNQLKDLSRVGAEYWQQPEFFPMFEQIGLPLLQNPPKDRWGAYGYLVYPSDSISIVSPNQTVQAFFFIKSGYLVETYQGISLKAMFPSEGVIANGEKLPDGSNKIIQNTDISKYFDVTISPHMFVLDPNYPIYNLNGTMMINMSIYVHPETPKGTYLVAIDTTEIPKDIEQDWILKYKNAYVSGSMTKIERPYYQAFISVE